ncbi:energy transducer TonB [Alkalicaulis satelles]|nr:energy transducer TonB [Alkalicaulis satelles]
MTALSQTTTRRTGSPGAVMRFLLAGLLALGVTGALFLFMRALIEVAAPPPEDAPPVERIVINFKIADREPAPVAVMDIPAVEPPPPFVQIRTPSAAVEGVEGVHLTPPIMAIQLDPITTPPVAFTIPSLTGRVEPVYPQRELARGIQGSCTVRYDILASGATANLQVLDCDSPGFARASFSAVQRWTHASDLGRPGHEIVRRGVETRLDFQLE